MRVAVHPPFRGSRQRYGALLYEACQALDPSLEVEEVRLVRPSSARSDVVHLHWPENLASGQLLRAVARIALFHLVLSAAKRWGAAVVWTVHNLQSHAQEHPRLERVHLRLLAQRTDGLCFLNNWSREAFVESFPRLREAPHVVARIGPYVGAVTRPARPMGDRPNILFFGLVRPYKGLDDLITAAAQVSADLTVLGSDPDEGTRARVGLLTSGSILDGYSEPQLLAAAAGADVAVFPFRAVNNSSSVLHALSLGLPVVAPSLPAMAELHDAVGSDWVYLYPPGPLTSSALAEALSWVARRGSPPGPDLTSMSWHTAAQSTLGLYRDLCRAAG